MRRYVHDGKRVVEVQDDSGMPYSFTRGFTRGETLDEQGEIGTPLPLEQLMRGTLERRIKLVLDLLEPVTEGDLKRYPAAIWVRIKDAISILKEGKR